MLCVGCSTRQREGPEERVSFGEGGNRCTRVQQLTALCRRSRLNELSKVKTNSEKLNRIFKIVEADQSV